MPGKYHVSLLQRTPILATRLFFCPSCSQIRRFSSRPTSAPRSITTRSASTFPGSSIISATKNIPERFQELYKALEELKNTSGNYVDLSRLQLAQRGIETENPLIRIAVFGVGDTQTSARLVRLLLADPLGPKEAWEDQLGSRTSNESGSFLIRYGDKYQVSSGASPLPTISIPSNLLRKANLEIQMSPLGANIFSIKEPVPNSLQVATVAIPSTDGSPATHIQYPVHRSIICGNGVDGVFTFARLIGRADTAELGPLKAVFQLPLDKAPENSNGEVSFIDIDRAEVALDKFRESAQNATDYQEGWDRSRIQPIIDWLAAAHTDQAVSPDLRHLLDSVLKEADAKIEEHEKKTLADVQASSVPEEVRKSLDVMISGWAERAHEELRVALDEAFRCKSWQSLVWWKLFWRVDDVPMICSSLLQRQWLTQAEKEALWIGGRFQQARLLEDDSTAASEKYVQATGDPPPKSSSSTPGFTPWRTQITESRNKLTASTVMPLHSLAQSLVMFSLSTTGLTSALSALTYISTTTASFSEAGTFAAVGLIYSVWRQQKKWDLARKTWETDIREEGRKALRHTEDSMRMVIRDGNRPAMPPIETEAKESIQKARNALSDVL
ncbi:hypothetical protein MGYG_04011 [Nannizzia gypsea CBS 118893]|uniref:Mmc1 C-terminal domain-containing protein n=1 Tax=Arthroderma gypseum (strain ATCC MYA-4604 / CBS 118893) TaxID=535722 RepID=E4UUP2_ARTGP|nr:hypothetical protein MGYG_04011 [Nannizzia gypsea CBS 118893]EFR01009.1 hypothetical protein MGYG_04011 [Nannizzia gypsea CBS 118893]